MKNNSGKRFVNKKNKQVVEKKDRLENLDVRMKSKKESNDLDDQYKNFNENSIENDKIEKLQDTNDYCEKEDVAFENEFRKKYKNDFLNKYIDLDEEEIFPELDTSNIDDDTLTEMFQDTIKPKSDSKKMKKKKKKKKRKFLKTILVLFLLSMLCAMTCFAYKTYENGGGVARALQTVMGHNEQTKKQLGPFTCLILGVSTDLDATLTDTIMVASYNPNTQKASLFSIQRDTFIGNSRANATGGDKINAVYSYSGAEGTLKQVNKLTGLDIKYYAVIKTEALIELVDELGGITFNVPINMTYDDTSQDLHINLKAGEQVLDGKKAEMLVRFRHNNDGSSYSTDYGDNDIGRMRTQREFMAEVLRQTCKVSNIFKMRKIIDVAKRNVETNIDLEVLKDYIPYLVEFNTSNLQSASIPGKAEYFANLWFFTPDKKETLKIVNQLFLARDEEETDDSTKIKDPSKISIKLQNGSGSEEVLNTVKEKLKNDGYKVSVDKKNTNTTTTTIYNRNFIDNENLDKIKSLIGDCVVSNNSSNNSQIDIVIVLGSDLVK